jgi:hypothetical protein
MLKKLMDDNDISNVALAEAIGKSDEYVCQIKGGHPCPLETAADIIIALRQMLPRPRPRLTLYTIFKIASRRYRVRSEPKRKYHRAKKATDED